MAATVRLVRIIFGLLWLAAVSAAQASIPHSTPRLSFSPSETRVRGFAPPTAIRAPELRLQVAEVRPVESDSLTIGVSGQKVFLSADPSGIDSFPNLYAYANANPAFFTDPYGLCGDANAPQTAEEDTADIRNVVASRYPLPGREAAAAQYAEAQAVRFFGFDLPLAVATSGIMGPSDLVAEEGTPLFRAVTEGELNSIKQSGQFSVVPGSSTPLPGVQGKWFYGSLEDAQSWAGQAAARDGGPLTIIQTTVPKSVGPAYSQPWVDGIQNPAQFYGLGNLKAPITILPGTIP